MKIAQIILKEVQNFQDSQYSFVDEWRKGVPSSILLMGPNGCGKTTLLRTISNLWFLFGSFLEGKETVSTLQLSILSNSRLMAMEIQGFLPEFSESFWICCGVEEEVEKFMLGQKESYKIFGIYKGASLSKMKIGYFPPQETNSSQDIESLRKRYTKNLLGGGSDLPNLLFLESEVRTLSKIKGTPPLIPEKENFTWLARYTATERREGSIQNYLFTLKAANEKKYDRIVSAINQFFPHKKIHGFDPKTAELLVTTKNGQSHPIHLLSSGEKQILLMIAFITRELKRGGVILIDEPDLHLHISLNQTFVSYLKRITIEEEGQLVIASHAKRLWESFPQNQKINLTKA